MTNNQTVNDDESSVGDVETAGETTAAATLSSDTSHDKPVGADTLVKVADEPTAQGSDDD